VSKLMGCHCLDFDREAPSHLMNLLKGTPHEKMSQPQWIRRCEFCGISTSVHREPADADAQWNVIQTALKLHEQEKKKMESWENKVCKESTP